MDDKGAQEGRVAALDLLRGLAAIAVAIPHFLTYNAIRPKLFESISVLGVELFFVLSGFVLGPQIVGCVRSGRMRDLSIFLVRRWMRTVPPYVLALVGVALQFQALYSSDFLLSLFYVQNLFRYAVSPDFFPIAWSLSVEEWFYGVFPVFLLLAAALLQRRGATTCAVLAVGFIVTISAVRLAFGDLDDWGLQVRRVVAYRINSIAYGFLLFLCVQAIGLRRLVSLRLAAGIALGGFLMLIAWLAWDIASTGSAIAKQLYPFVAAGFGVSAVGVFAAFDAFAGRNRRLRAACLVLGKISYPVYLFHFSAMVLLKSHFDGVWWPLAIYVTGVPVFSWFFHVTFERPILLARPQLSAKAPPMLLRQQTQGEAV